MYFDQKQSLQILAWKMENFLLVLISGGGFINSQLDELGLCFFPERSLRRLERERERTG